MSARTIRDGAWDVFSLLAVICMSAVTLREWAAAELVATIAWFPAVVWLAAAVWIGAS